MHRLFLDADVLFTAAWRPKGGLSGLWDLEDVTLLTSLLAFAQAQENVTTAAQRGALTNLAVPIYFVATPPVFELPGGIRLPPQHRPILAAAIEGQATHFLSGNQALYAPYYGQTVDGVLLQHPGEYLRLRHGLSSAVE